MSNIQSRESGVVSIFTVMFFIIFISIITVGFLKIVGDEQRQSVDNDLSASALTAANSGVEEAKRVLLFCQTTTQSTERNACYNDSDKVLNNPSCNALTAKTAVTSALGIDTDNGEGVVSGNSGYLQRWTCLTIDTLTDDVDDVSIANGQTELIPLTSDSEFTTLVLKWHATSSTREGIPGGYPVGTSPRMSQPEWTNNKYPAALRVEIISHPTGAINLNSIDANTRTIVLFPSTTGSLYTTYPIASYDVRATDPNMRTTPSPLTVKCNDLAALPTYACTVNLTFGSMPSTRPTDNKYYARVSALYANTHIHMELEGPSEVKFDNVQPEVDVTGRANDVFRRIKARLQYDTTAYMPNYAVESGQSFCKDMLVTDKTTSSSTAACP